MTGLVLSADRCGRSESGVGLGRFGRDAAGGLKAGDPLLKAPDAGVGGGHFGRSPTSRTGHTIQPLKVSSTSRHQWSCRASSSGRHV